MTAEKAVGMPPDALFDREALGLERFYIPFGGAIFAPGRFGKRPDVGVPLRPVTMPLVDKGKGGFMGRRKSVHVGVAQRSPSFPSPARSVGEGGKAG